MATRAATNLDFVKWLTKSVGNGVKPKKGRSKRAQVAVNTIARCVGYLEHDAPKRQRRSALYEAANHLYRPVVRPIVDQELKKRGVL